MRLLSNFKDYSKLLKLMQCNQPQVCYASLRPSPVNDNSDIFPYTGRQGDPLKIKPNRDPFLKNIIMGKYDVEFLVYPEVLDLERLKNIDQLSEILNNFWKDEIRDNPNYFDTGIPANFVESVTNFGLFKQKIPYEYNGIGMTATETAKVSEIMGRHILSSNLVTGQNTVHDVLNMAHEPTKEYYFNKILHENLKGAICFNENKSEFDLRLSTTSIQWNEELNKYIVSGQKVWVLNADRANFFIVFGKLADHGKENSSIVTVIVDKNKPGIKITSHANLGFHIVEFDKVQIEETDIIVDKTKGTEIANKVLSMNMFYFASSVVGMVKDAFDYTTQFLTYRQFLGRFATDSEATQVILAKLASDIYALEAMVYMTAYLMDGFESQDHEVELAVLKIFASDVSWNVITECINLLGPHAAMHSYMYPFMETLESIKRMSLLSQPNDFLKMFVAIKCIEHNKSYLSDYIMKIRKPHFHFHEAMKHKMYCMKNERDVPALDLNLHYHLHPSLKSCADALEYSVKRLEYANIKLLENFGAETYDNHYSLMRLSNIITEIYAMNSVLARASRSYCTGIQNCDFELLSADVYGRGFLKNVKKNVTEIVDGPLYEIDLVAKKLADKVIESKGYYAQHPLARNII